MLSSNEELNFVAIDFAVTSATMHRRLFSTETGYIGLGPRNMEQGDLVYVFAGGHTPFVVHDARSVESDRTNVRQCYNLIGDCYLHGIMDGEAMRDGRYDQRDAYLV